MTRSVWGKMGRRTNRWNSCSLRAIPGLITLRPADANEVVEAWRMIMPFRHEPVALILTRQALPTVDRTTYASAEGVQRGAYSWPS